MLKRPTSTFEPVIAEKAKRLRHAAPLKVLNLTPSQPTEKAHFGAPGSITVLFARKGSKALGIAQRAVQEGGPALKSLVDLMTKQLLARGSKALTADEMVREIVSSDSFAEIRYAGDVLNSGVYLPKGIDVLFVQLPYNGGQLAKEGFSLVEFLRDGKQSELEAFAVRVDPPLTAAERAALNEVSADQLVLNVGAAMDCDTTYIAVAVVAVTLVAAAAVGAAEVATAAWAVCQAVCGRSFQDNFHIAEATLKTLGPNASARDLLAVRRAILMGETPSASLGAAPVS